MEGESPRKICRIFLTGFTGRMLQKFGNRWQRNRTFHCKKIIEDHGGKIWATSKEDSGTTMYFVIRKYQEVTANEQNTDR